MSGISYSNPATGYKLNGHQAAAVVNKASDHKQKTCAFQMPLHYPRYKRDDYEKMPEWKLDCLLKEYGLPVNIGDVEQKRKFAMGAFLWA